MFQAALCGRHAKGNANVTGALAYGWQEVAADRTVLGIVRLRARFDANTLSGRIESGYRFAAQLGCLTPYAAGRSRRSACPIMPSRWSRT